MLNEDNNCFKINLFPCRIEYFTFIFGWYKEILHSQDIRLNQESIQDILKYLKNYYKEEFKSRPSPLGIDIYKYNTNNKEILLKSYLIKKFFHEMIDLSKKEESN